MKGSAGTAGRTDAGLFGGRALVALVAAAVVGPGRVDTVPVDAGVAHTLVHIWKREGRENDAAQTSACKFPAWTAEGSAAQQRSSKCVN